MEKDKIKLVGVMPAYNEVDGEPIHASQKYLRSILRDELGFNGMIISDYGGVEMLHNFHYVAPNALEAGKMALAAGIDIEAPTLFGYGEAFRTAIINGEIDEKLVDEAVLNILTLKFELGLFENPYTDPDRIKQMHSEKNVDLALRLDEESIVLLEDFYQFFACKGANKDSSFIEVCDFIGRKLL
jgi:beta-glucosidase